MHRGLNHLEKVYREREREREREYLRFCDFEAVYIYSLYSFTQINMIQAPMGDLR